MLNPFQRLLKELKTTFRFSFFLNENSYPKSVLPQRHYKEIDFDVLFQLSNPVVVRRSNKQTYEDTFDRIGLVKVDAIQRQTTKEMIGLSMNLLGGYFKENHLHFNPKGKAVELWAFGSPTLKLRDLTIESSNNKIGIFYNVASLHNNTFQFPVQSDKVTYKKLPKELAISTDENLFITTFRATLKILHKPTYSNYWHVELHIQPNINNEDEIISTKEVQKAQYKKCTEFALNNYIIAKGKRNIDEPLEIRKELFQ